MMIKTKQTKLQLKTLDKNILKRWKRLKIWKIKQKND